MIVRQRTFDVEQVEAIFRLSEIRPTNFCSKKSGHTFKSHIGISNAKTADRGEKVHNGKVVAITSFITNESAFSAAAELLNSDPARAALVYLDAEHNGMRTTVTYSARSPVIVRYLGGGGVKTMPSFWFCMVMDRNGVEPYGLHMRTFFPLIDPEAELRAWIEDSNGKGGEKRVFPFPLRRPN